MQELKTSKKCEYNQGHSWDLSMSLCPVAGSGRLLLRGRATAALRATLPGRRRGAGAAGGAEAADAGQSSGAAQLHAGRRRSPDLLLAAVCPGLVRLPTLLPLQPPQPRGPQRWTGAGRSHPVCFPADGRHLKTLSGFFLALLAGRECLDEPF